MLHSYNYIRLFKCKDLSSKNVKPWSLFNSEYLYTSIVLEGTNVLFPPKKEILLQSPVIIHQLHLPVFHPAIVYLYTLNSDVNHLLPLWKPP